jgi:hypothetical protein
MVAGVLLRAGEPAGSSEAGAGLEFSRREISVVTEPGAAGAEVGFEFVNRAGREVVVREVKAACGCTVAKLDKTTYAPGESGVVRVVFTAGGRAGRQSLPVKVRTDAGDHDLVLLAEIPARVTMMPRLVVFRGGETGEKTVRLSYHAATPVAVLAGDAEEGSVFRVKVREVERGREFEVVVSYVGEAGVAHTEVHVLRSRDAAGREFADRLYLRHAP